MLVGFSGILACGKSTVAARVARSLGAHTYLEPEERAYPDFVTNGTDAFSTHMWFRSSRVHNLLQADAASRAGATAVVDTLYDKMLHHYLGNDDFSWLMSPHDAYFPILRDLAALDEQTLPALDTIVFLTVDEHSWLQRLHARNRRQDTVNNIRSAFGMQERMLDACEHIAQVDHSTLIQIDTSGRPVEQVLALVTQSLATTPERMGQLL